MASQHLHHEPVSSILSLLCFLVSLVPPKSGLQKLHPQRRDALPCPRVGTTRAMTASGAEMGNKAAKPPAPRSISFPVGRSGPALLLGQGKLSSLRLLQWMFPRSLPVQAALNICVSNDDEHWKYVSLGNKDQMSPSTM